MANSELETLIGYLAKLPGLGPRSARRAVLHLIRNRENLLDPLIRSLNDTASRIEVCSNCGNIDIGSICGICRDTSRDDSAFCVVEDVSDLWAIERSHLFKGHYHVLGGTLSALDGVQPEDLKIGKLIQRAQENAVKEVILATSATVDGQTTAHYIRERLAEVAIETTQLAHGIPVGGELDYLDEGTLTAAFHARKVMA